MRVAEKKNGVNEKKIVTLHIEKKIRYVAIFSSIGEKNRRFLVIVENNYYDRKEFS